MIFRSFNRCYCRARSSKSENIWEVTGVPFSGLSQSILGLHENKRPHRKRVYVESLTCKCMKSCDWLHIIFVQRPVRFVAVHGLNTEGNREQWWWLGLLLSARSFPLQQDSRQVPSERWSYRQTSPLHERVWPLPAQMSGLRLTSKGFLWEVSPEKLKAVGKGKLKLDEQQAPG